MRLADDTLWYMPMTLDVPQDLAAKVKLDKGTALCDVEGIVLPILSISDKWISNKAREAQMVVGADDVAHPAVNHLHPVAGLEGVIVHSAARDVFEIEPLPIDGPLRAYQDRRISGLRNGSNTEDAVRHVSTNAIGLLAGFLG